jgi:hypothetical protein
VTESDDDFARQGRATVDATGGDVLDVVLSVVRGGCIEGTVSWSDGSPVKQFEIALTGDGTWRKEGGSFGHFSLCGLEDQDLRLELRATQEGVTASAVVVARPSPTPLELVLEPVSALDVRGTVVDERGRPVAGASVDATAMEEGFRRVEARSVGDGTFVLPGLERGRWGIEATAQGRLPDRRTLVVEDESIDPLVLVLSPAGDIRGTVVDAAGAPVAGAWVGDDEAAHAVRFFGAQGEETDAQGRFAIEAPSTRPRLVALKQGFAPSAVVEVTVDPGESVDGIVLRLQPTCRVEGVVLDASGQPLAGARVAPSTWPPLASADTDARGRFQLTDLAPGSIELTASHPDQKQGATASARVTLVPGRTETVELRFEDRDPVRVRGRITRGGRPIAYGVDLRSKSFRISSMSDADGRLELELQRPGAWTGTVMLASELESRQPASLQEMLACDIRRLELAIPDADEHVFELDFDSLPRIATVEELVR